MKRRYNKVCTYKADLPAVERLRLSASQDRATGCWVWVRGVDRDGYGYIGIDRKYWRAHRAAYHLLVGPIPDGLVIDHLCKNTRCVNPAHLEAVSRAENTRRGSRPTKTHCIRGHAFDSKNTHRVGYLRNCRKCSVVRAAKYRMKKEGR